MTPELAAQTPLEQLCLDMLAHHSCFSKMSRVFEYSDRMQAAIGKQVRQAVLENLFGNGEERLSRDETRGFAREGENLIEERFAQGTPVQLVGCALVESEFWYRPNMGHPFPWVSMCEYVELQGMQRTIDFPEYEIPSRIHQAYSESNKNVMAIDFAENIRRGRQLLSGKVECKSRPEEFEAAEKVRLTHERVELLREIGRNIEKTAAQLKNLPNSDWLRDEFLKKADQLKQFYEFASTTPMYEVQICSSDHLPAFYDIEKRAIYFYKGQYSPLLGFHEMGHAAQFGNRDHVERTYHSFSSDTERTIVVHQDHRFVGNSQLFLEEENWQWTIEHIFDRVGIEMFKAYLVRTFASHGLPTWKPQDLMDGTHKLTLHDCAIAAGKVPEIYQRTLQIFHRIKEFRGFSETERDSALALVSAYMNIEVLPNGQLQYKPHALPIMLAEFYGLPFTPEPARDPKEIPEKDPEWSMAHPEELMSIEPVCIE